MVIRQATVDLSERQLRVLALDLVIVPVVRQAVQGDFEDLCLRSNKPELATGALLDVGIGELRGHGLQLPRRTGHGSAMDCTERNRGYQARLVEHRIAAARAESS